MRQIGTLPDESQARRLADYLLTLDVEAEVRPAHNAWGVWIVKEDQVDRGRQELASFLLDPNNGRYAVAARAARDRRRDAARAEREHARNTVELRDRLDVISPRRCPVVHILIVLSVLAAVVTGFGRNYAELMPFYLAPPADAEAPPGVAYSDLPSVGLKPLLRGEVWRLFTPMFIHYGIRHLVFNMLSLYWFGGLIELRKNSWTLLALVLAACPISFLAQYAWDYQMHGLARMGAPGGMSGVVYALFGYSWIRGEYDPDSGLRVASSTVALMFIWLALCATGAMGPIANAAHVGGLAFGIGAGLGPYFLSPRTET